MLVTFFTLVYEAKFCFRRNVYPTGLKRSNFCSVLVLRPYFVLCIRHRWADRLSCLRSLLQPQSDGNSQLSADDFAHYFPAKIDRIRTLTASSPSPVINDHSVDQPLSGLAPVTADEVVKILQKSPAEQCKLDPVYPLSLSSVPVMSWLQSSLQSATRRSSNSYFHAAVRVQLSEHC